METIFINKNNLADYQKQATSKIIALGYFDGLHAGHRKVITEAKKLAKLHQQQFAVMSFTPHPKVVLSDGKLQVPKLMSLSEKQDQLEQLGVDILYMVEFTKEFASLNPEQFVNNYLLGLKVVHVVAGFDFTYGHKGIGNLDRLIDDANGQLAVTKVKKVELDGEKISSSCIRERITNGEVDMLPYFLGHYYESKGSWNGTELSLSTECMIPRNGNYIVVIKQGNKKIQTELMVNEGRIQCNERLPQSFIGTVHLEWKKQIYTNEYIYSN
ncbi:FAD synthetase family protein [Ureibacillus sp. NPDC094379]